MNFREDVENNDFENFDYQRYLEHADNEVDNEADNED